MILGFEFAHQELETNGQCDQEDDYESHPLDAVEDDGRDGSELNGQGEKLSEKAEFLFNAVEVIGNDVGDPAHSIQLSCILRIAEYPPGHGQNQSCFHLGREQRSFKHDVVMETLFHEPAQSHRSYYQVDSSIIQVLRVGDQINQHLNQQQPSHLAYAPHETETSHHQDVGFIGLVNSRQNILNRILRGLFLVSELFGCVRATILILDVRSIFNRYPAMLKNISDLMEGVEGVEEQGPS